MFEIFPSKCPRHLYTVLDVESVSSLTAYPAQCSDRQTRRIEQDRTQQAGLQIRSDTTPTPRLLRSGAALSDTTLPVFGQMSE